MNHETFNPFDFESLVWDWPIAVYLFLVGVSAGVVIVAILLKRLALTDSDQPIKDNPIFKSMAIIAPFTVVFGLFILIFHLSNPWAFWRIMVYYSPKSVMSLGVILFQVYMVFLFVWLAILYRAELNKLLAIILRGKLPFIPKLFNWVIDKVTRFTNLLETLSLICAFILGAYTGFLLSALKSYPLLNNPTLPVLFMISGISSGAAMCIFASLLWFKESTHSPNLAFIHKLEFPVVMLEIFLLCAFFIGSYFGGGQKAVAVVNAIGGGFWSDVFWYGVVGLGIATPLILNFISPDRIKHTKSYLIFVASCTLIGIFMLRHFILYAGQMTLV